jgi:succinate dehydrogenase/fumarate reductase flavoprotein subunit
MKTEPHPHSHSPITAADIAQWHGRYDVIVVGFGAAGACAAIAAADAGCSVLICDIASGSGGSTALSSAELYLGAGTRVQKACGYNDSVEAMYDYLMLSNGPQADPAKIRAYCEGSADHFDWLVDLGVPFNDSEFKARAIVATTDDGLLYTGSEKAWPYVESIAPAPRGHNLAIKGDHGGPLFMKILTAAALQRGVEVHFETRALRLIEDSGEVVGLVVRSDMQERYLRSNQGVILSAGGFVMNREMLAEYAPDLMRCNLPIGNAGDTGSGILIGQSMGAAVTNMHEGFVSLPFYPPSSLTFGIFINAHGKRFINEDCYHGRVGAHVLQQPSGPVYLVLSVEDYGKYETHSYLGAAVAATGETLDELLAELDVPENQLRQTIECYNSHAEQLADPEFHKSGEWLKSLTAPFVALDCTPGRGVNMPYFTLGGLDTRVSGEVLTEAGEIIPGLYAAGRTACGVPRRADGYASGISVGDASFSGRMAGAAAGAREKR